jgi:hypothetical protein
MKNKPFAFCGSTGADNPRTKWHVLQKSMYPEVGAESIQRITVPECGQVRVSGAPASIQASNSARRQRRDRPIFNPAGTLPAACSRCQMERREALLKHL